MKSHLNENDKYINEGAIIPLNMKWRAGINDPAAVSKPRAYADPGYAMAQAFVQSLKNTPPPVDIPKPRMSKQAQYNRDLLNNMAPIPSFGVNDDRPETQGDLIAQQHPQMIAEPAQSSNVGYEFSQSGKFIGTTELLDMPVNGLPDINL